jgi:CRISPR-associated protein Csc3
LNKPRYSDRDPASLFFFSLRAPMQKKKLTDTDAWIDPAFYALALPLLLDIKVVVSSSFTPLYSSGADFRETSILDAPHSFINYILGNDRLRVNEIEPMLWRLLHLYELHLDVFKDPNSGKREDMHFSMLNSVAKDIVTDPLYVFSYYERKQRKPKDDAAPKKGKAKAKKSSTPSTTSEGIPPFVVERYMAIYAALKTERNDPMSFISKLVDSYAVFYRADYAHLDSAYTVLRPLGTAIDITKNSSPITCEEDLILLIAGAIEDEMDRVKNDAATSGGYDPLGRKSATGLEQSRQAIRHFAEQFVELCFKQYCQSDRGILRERANRIRSAANFYYLSQSYARRNRV